MIIIIINKYVNFKISYQQAHFPLDFTSSFEESFVGNCAGCFLTFSWTNFNDTAWNNSFTP